MGSAWPQKYWGWTLASCPLVQALVAVAEASSRSNLGRPFSGESPQRGVGCGGVVEVGGVILP